MKIAKKSWVARKLGIPIVSDRIFERYVDDGIAHCRTLDNANEHRIDLVRRFGEWKPEHIPTKTNILNYKENNRKGT